MADQQATQKPSIGRTVHFHYRVSKQTEELRTVPAVVYEVLPDPGAVSLVVLDYRGATVKHVAFYSEAPKQDCWSWPPKV